MNGFQPSSLCKRSCHIHGPPYRTFSPAAAIAACASPAVGVPSGRWAVAVGGRPIQGGIRRQDVTARAFWRRRKKKQRQVAQPEDPPPDPESFEADEQGSQGSEQISAGDDLAQERQAADVDESIGQQSEPGKVEGPSIAGWRESPVTTEAIPGFSGIVPPSLLASKGGWKDTLWISGAMLLGLGVTLGIASTLAKRAKPGATLSRPHPGGKGREGGVDIAESRRAQGMEALARARAQDDFPPLLERRASHSAASTSTAVSNGGGHHSWLDFPTVFLVVTEGEGSAPSQPPSLPLQPQLPDTGFWMLCEARKDAQSLIRWQHADYQGPEASSSDPGASWGVREVDPHLCIRLARCNPEQPGLAFIPRDSIQVEEGMSMWEVQAELATACFTLAPRPWHRKAASSVQTEAERLYKTAPQERSDAETLAKQFAEIMMQGKEPQRAAGASTLHDAPARTPEGITPGMTGEAGGMKEPLGREVDVEAMLQISELVEREAAQAGDQSPARFIFELAKGEEGTTIELAVPHALRPLWEEYSGLALPQGWASLSQEAALEEMERVHSDFVDRYCQLRDAGLLGGGEYADVFATYTDFLIFHQQKAVSDRLVSDFFDKVQGSIMDAEFAPDPPSTSDPETSPAQAGGAEQSLSQKAGSTDTIVPRIRPWARKARQKEDLPARSLKGTPSGKATAPPGKSTEDAEDSPEASTLRRTVEEEIMDSIRNIMPSGKKDEGTGQNGSGGLADGEEVMQTSLRPDEWRRCPVLHTLAARDEGEPAYCKLDISNNPALQDWHLICFVRANDAALFHQLVQRDGLSQLKPWMVTPRQLEDQTQGSVGVTVFKPQELQLATWLRQDMPPALVNKHISAAARRSARTALRSSV